MEIWITFLDECGRTRKARLTVYSQLKKITEVEAVEYKRVVVDKLSRGRKK